MPSVTASAGRPSGAGAEVMPAQRSRAGDGGRAGLRVETEGAAHTAGEEASVPTAAWGARGKDPRDRQGPGRSPVCHVGRMFVFLLKLMLIHRKKKNHRADVARSIEISFRRQFFHLSGIRLQSRHVPEQAYLRIQMRTEHLPFRALCGCRRVRHGSDVDLVVQKEKHDPFRELK